MSATAPRIGDLRTPVPAIRLGTALRAAGPSLLFGLRLWASVSLALYVAFWLELDNPYWAGTSAAIVCQPQLGASLRKGWFRMIGTLIGAVMGLVLVACFPHDRLLFLGSLALWGAVCAFAATVLRNFASYAAALAGYTAAIVVGDLLGAVGGVDADAAFLLSVTRASEICLGIVCAGVVLAGTDLGGAQRRLGAQVAELAASITAGITRALGLAGRDAPDPQPARREFIRRIAALDPVIDQTLGESAEIRYHSPVLQRAADGLFAALCGWRAIAGHVHGPDADNIQREAAAVLENLPAALQSASSPGAAELWAADPVALHRLCSASVRRLIALPAATPMLRLLADKTAEALAGIGDALEGLALLAGDPARPIPLRGSKRIRVPDLLPALVNAGRALLTIGSVALFWIVTAWPGGGNAITFAAIIVLLLAPRAEQAYGAAVLFTMGAILALLLIAIVEFGILPAVSSESFASLSLVLGGCLVPIGALLAHARQPWQIGLLTGMTTVFVPLFQPTNPMTYSLQGFFNSGSVIVFGACVAALSFRLLPPLPPGLRERRLLALTLRDLRRLALGRGHDDWDGLVYGRLSAMPDEAAPLQRAQLLAALSAGREIIRLRYIVCNLGVGLQLGAALDALVEGRSAQTVAQLSRLNDVLAHLAAGEQTRQPVLRARAGILTLTQALTEHAAFFDAAWRP